MATTTKEELMLTWKALRRSSSPTGWSRMNIGSSGSIDIMAGLQQPENAEALIVLFPSLTAVKSSSLPQGGGFQVTCENIDSEPGRWILVVKADAGPIDLFTLMASDVADTLLSYNSYDESKKYQAMLGRIRAWQSFMKPGRDRLTQEEELGLVGELSCIKAIISSGMPVDSVIDSWVGPEDAAQDFEIGSGAIEAKSTLAETGFPAKIQSLEQLDDSQRKPLIVAGCRFSLDASGQTLPERAQELNEQIKLFPGACDRLALLLLRAGYHSSQADLYSRKFTGPNFQFWLVNEYFPRLTTSLVPQGIRSASYTIELEDAGTQIPDLKTALKILEGE